MTTPKTNIDLKQIPYTIVVEGGVSYITVNNSDLKSNNIQQVGYEDHQYMVNGKYDNKKAYDDGPIYEDQVNQEGAVIGRQYHFGFSNKPLKTGLRIIY